MPQLAAPWLLQTPAGSVPPDGTAAQEPAAPGSAHDMQVPAQAVAQQTPCAQFPLWQSGPCWQRAPFGLSPHEPLGLQYWPCAQSLSVVQADSQAFTPQMNGKQGLGGGVRQVPVPSHVAPAVKVPPGIGQLAFAQAVPCWYFWQMPAWHLPSVPQEVIPWSVQRPAGSGWPVATLVQRPIDPVTAHDTQEPAQEVAQQTPCAHWPDLHSAPSEQKAPFGLGPHEPLAQVLAPEQLVSLLQAVKQRVPLQT